MSIIKQFVRERDKAVLTYDLDVFKKFYRKWQRKGVYDVPLPSDRVIELSMRKMVCEMQSATAAQKKEAREWLLANGSRPMFGG